MRATFRRTRVPATARVIIYKLWQTGRHDCEQKSLAKRKINGSRDLTQNVLHPSTRTKHDRTGFTKRNQAWETLARHCHRETLKNSGSHKMGHHHANGWWWVTLEYRCSWDLIRKSGQWFWLQPRSWSSSWLWLPPEEEALNALVPAAKAHQKHGFIGSSVHGTSG